MMSAICFAWYTVIDAHVTFENSPIQAPREMPQRPMKVVPETAILPARKYFREGELAQPSRASCLLVHCPRSRS